MRVLSLVVSRCCKEECPLCVDEDGYSLTKDVYVKDIMCKRFGNVDYYSSEAFPVECNLEVI